LSLRTFMAHAIDRARAPRASEALYYVWCFNPLRRWSREVLRILGQRNQGCAESQKRFRVGLPNEVSSSVPDGIRIMFGATPASHATAAPHSGQKRRVTGLPLPPGLVNVLLSPSIRKVSFGMNTRVAKAVP